MRKTKIHDPTVLIENSHQNPGVPFYTTGSKRGSEPDGRERIRRIARKRGSRGGEDREQTRITRKRKIRRTRGMDQREDRSHGESAIRADCEEACAGGGEDREEARIVSRRGSRGSERAYITSENGKGLATHGERAERARRARSVKGTWCGIERMFNESKNRFPWEGCLSRKDRKHTLGCTFSLPSYLYILT